MISNISKIFLPTITAVTIAASAQAITLGPVSEKSGTWARASVQSSTNAAPLNVITDGALNIIDPGTIDITSFTSGSDDTGIRGEYAYRSDNAAGEAGASAYAERLAGESFASTRSEVTLFDTLQFDFGELASGLVSFSLGIEGFLVAESANALVLGTGRVTISDVTGLADSFFLSGQKAFPEGALLKANGSTVIETEDAIGVVPDTIVDVAGGLALLDADAASSVGEGFRIGFADAFVAIEDGFAFEEFERNLSGSFTAISGHSYAITVETFALSNIRDGWGGADLLGTTAFAFTDLAGGTLSSASGTFPGSTIVLDPPVSAVPDTGSTAAIMACGFAGLIGLRRFRTLSR